MTGTAPGGAVAEDTVEPVQPIVALDVPSMADAQALVRRIGPQLTFCKVGLQLFTAEGPRVIDWLHGEGKRVFLDLKCHDIPTTVGRAAAEAARHGVALLTVHGLGGEAMVRAAVDAAAERTGILVVTVLTSMDLAAASAALGRHLASLTGEVLRVTAVARGTGAHGVVCGGAESLAVKAAHGNRLRVLVPGVRLHGTSSDDQARVTTPQEAVRNGASYIVLGRAVTKAADPAAAFARVLELIA